MAKPNESIKAFAYLRTSSAANIGEDKDSGQGQLHAVQAFTKRAERSSWSAHSTTKR